MEQIKQRPAPHAAAVQEIKSTQTVCGICSGTCGMTLKLENGMVA